MPIIEAALLATLASSNLVEHRVVRVGPPSAKDPSEVAVAINPKRPENILAVSLQRHSPSTDFAYLSFDGGQSWSSVRGPNPHGRTQGDDAVAFDLEGNAFWSYISFTGLRVERPKDAANGIFVNRSGDGGRSWSPPVAVVDHRNTVSPFEDKPFLAVDTVRGSPHQGNVYVAWTRFTKYGSTDPADTSHIYFSLSEDDGQRFSAPIRVSDHAGDAVDSDGTLEGVVPAIGIDGTLFLAWSGPEGVVVDVSRDGGRTFGEDRVAFAHPGGWDIDIDGLGRANGMPVAGVDHSDGPHRGTLYINWIDDRHGDPDVFVASSRDGGSTWSAPTRVNDDAVGTGAAQFFTWMAVDPMDGSVNVAFYDRRGQTGTRTGVTLARSVDGGRTFENHPVSIEPFETNPDIFFGDYLGIAARGGRVIAVFSHFTGEKTLALSAATFYFREDSNE